MGEVGEETPKELMRELRRLSLAVSAYLIGLDDEMKKPSTSERGRNIARLSNELEVANDRVRYFFLGVDYRTDSPAKKRTEIKGRNRKPPPRKGVGDDAM